MTSQVFCFSICFFFVFLHIQYMYIILMTTPNFSIPTCLIGRQRLWKHSSNLCRLDVLRWSSTKVPTSQEENCFWSDQVGLSLFSAYYTDKCQRGVQWLVLLAQTLLQKARISFLMLRKELKQRSHWVLSENLSKWKMSKINFLLFSGEFIDLLQTYVIIELVKWALHELGLSNKIL